MADGWLTMVRNQVGFWHAGGAFSSGHDGFRDGLGVPARRLEVAAVWNDVGMRQWRSAGHVFVFHLVSGGTELVDDPGSMDGVPDQHGIGEKAEAIEDRMIRLETEQTQIITEARRAATAAVTMVVGNVISETVTRITRLALPAVRDLVALIGESA